MNKVILGLILAVCLLGMALVMLNERLGRKNETAQPAPAQEATMPSLADVGAPAQSTESAKVIDDERRLAAAVAEKARDFEDEEAREALAPPRAEIKPEPALPEPTVPPKSAPVKPEPRPEAKPEPRPEPRPAPVAEKPTPEKPAPARDAEKPKPAKSVDKTITKFVVFSREKGATVRLTGSSSLQPKSMLLENPTRLVIDLNGDWKFPDNPGIPKNDFISGIRVSKTGNRVVFDLKEKPRVWRLIPSKSADSFDVRVDK